MRLVPALLCCALAAWAEPLWLSETPPDSALLKKMRNTHGGPMEMIRGKPAKRLWLREGGHLEKAVYLPFLGSAFVADPTGAIEELSGKESIVRSLEKEGFYNLFFERVQSGDNGTLHQIAKHEVLNHSCRAGHDHVQDWIDPKPTDRVVFELIRERLGGENFHTLIASGDEAVFTVLFKGAPLAGATVKVFTQQGWQKSLTSDQNGQVRVQMIRDYYPKWSQFHKRHRESFVAAAYHTEGPKRYETTLSGSYHPGSRDYASYGYGLLLATIALVVTGAAVYLFRRRRCKPFKEEPLHG